MLNFVYCLDDKYNTQCICSIYSLLENVDEKIKITIIHKDKSTMCEIPSSILDHHYLETIDVKDKISLLKEYPMVGGTHVSKLLTIDLILILILKKMKITLPI